jgi:hypothetical protein
VAQIDHVVCCDRLALALAPPFGYLVVLEGMICDGIASSNCTETLGESIALSSLVRKIA